MKQNVSMECTERSSAKLIFFFSFCQFDTAINWHICHRALTSLSNPQEIFDQTVYIRTTSCFSTGSVNMAIGRLERASRLRADSSGGSTPPPNGSIWGSSPKQKVILTCLAISNMVNFMPQSLIAPFFPKEVVYYCRFNLDQRKST